MHILPYIVFFVQYLKMRIKKTGGWKQLVFFKNSLSLTKDKSKSQTTRWGQNQYLKLLLDMYETGNYMAPWILTTA